MSRGLLIVVSGPAGSGKGTVNSQLVATGDFVFSVSATTRAPRPGEVNGVNYHFIDREEFPRLFYFQRGYRQKYRKCFFQVLLLLPLFNPFVPNLAIYSLFLTNFE